MRTTVKFGRTSGRLLASGVVLAVLAALLTPLGVVQSASAQTPDDALNKRVTMVNGSTPVDAGNDGNVDVAGGDVVDWVVEYANTSGGPAQVEITDPIDTAGQTYVPGSLRVPTGWTRQWSDDGASYALAETDPVTHLRATALVGDEATGSYAAVPEPLVSTLNGGSTGGDGYVPIPYQDRVYNLFHHSVSPQLTYDLNCVIKATGDICPEFPDTGIALHLGQSTIAGHFGQSQVAGGETTTSIGIPNNPQHHVDAQGRLFYPYEIRSNHSESGSWEAGIACLQLGDTACVASDATLAIGSRSNNLYVIGGRAYTVLEPSGSIACIDLSTMASCAGYPVVMGPTSTYVLNYFGTGTVQGSRIYYDRVTAGDLPLVAVQTRIACFDTATGATCTNWPAGGVPAAAANVAVGMVFLDPGATMVCVGGAGLVANLNGTWLDGAVTNCWDTGTAAAAGSPPGLDALIGNFVNHLSYIAFEGYTVGTRTYLPTTIVPYSHSNWLGPVWSSVSDGTVTCYDWATNAACTGYTRSVVEDTKPLYGAVRDDELAGCAWALGDAGVLYSFDEGTGQAPCLRFEVSTVVDTTTGYYCDGRTDHVNGWSHAAFSPAPTAASWTTLTAIVSDSSTGAVLGTFDLLDGAVAPGGVVDLSGVSVIDHPSLTVSFDGNAVSASVWDSQYPGATLSFDGDAPQVCYQTRVVDRCDLGSTSNTAAVLTDTTTPFDQTVTDADPLSSTTITLDVSPAVTCRADVDIMKSSSSAGSLREGDFVTYAVTVTNSASRADAFSATNIVVVDHLPPGTTLDSHTGDPTYDPDDNTVTWTLAGPLDPGRSETFLLGLTLVDVATYVAAQDTTVDNRACIAGFDQIADDPDYDAGSPECATEVTSLVWMDLAVEKTHPAGVYHPGSTITYTVRGWNKAPNPASGVVLTDTIPEGTTLVSATGDPVIDGQNLTWPVGALAASDGAAGGPDEVTQSVTIRIAGDHLSAGGATTITNTATITDDGASGADQVPADNSDDDDELIEPMNLEVAKVVSTVGPIVAGSPISWTITVSNDSTVDASGVVASDTLPVGLTDPSSPEGGAPDNGRWVWPAFDLAAGASATFTLAMNIPGDYDTSVALENGVCASEGGNGPAAIANAHGVESDVDDNCDSVTTDLSRLNLSIDKTDGSVSVDAGTGAHVYTLTVANDSAVDAAGVVVRDTLPTGVVFVSASDNGSASAGVVTWSIGDLPAFATRTLTVTVSINGDWDSASIAGTGDLSNEACVAEEPSAHGTETTTDDNCAVDTTEVDIVDLDVTKRALDAEPYVFLGEQVTYEIVVTNNGGADATGAVLRDTIPSGLTHVGSGDGGSYDAATRTVSWSLGTVAVGESVTRSITVEMDADVDNIGRILTNRVCVTDDDLHGVDPDDVDCADATVVAQASDLRVTKDDGRTTVASGDELTYEITVFNDAEVEATGVTITDALPAGVELVSVQPDTATFDAAAGTVVFTVGTLTAADGDDAGGSDQAVVTVTVRVGAEPVETSVINRVAATDDGTHGVDPTPENNLDDDVDVLDLASFVSSAGAGLSGSTGGTEIPAAVAGSGAGRGTSTTTGTASPELAFTGGATGLLALLGLALLGAGAMVLRLERRRHQHN